MKYQPSQWGYSEEEEKNVLLGTDSVILIDGRKMTGILTSFLFYEGALSPDSYLYGKHSRQDTFD